MAQVSLQQVRKVFENGVVGLHALDLEIGDGEFMILVGPSGCGKSTTLRIVAGLEKATSGRIAIDERVVNAVSARDRDIAMVFQNYALYPHMTVFKNLAFGLKQRHVPRPELKRRVHEAAGMLGLEELLDRRPAQLSGGQRQRVAMGRALVREPKVFLLDEPLSNLDAKLRVQMRGDLKRLHQRLGITTIFVTHDQVEAMTLGDRIAVMSGGELQQVGEPQDVYDRPRNLFVATFIGSPAMNLLRATVRNGTVTAGDLELPLAGLPEGEVVLGVRPECLQPALDGQPAIEFRVDVVEPLGEAMIVQGTVGGQLAEPERAEELLPPLPGSRAVLTARFDPQLRPRPGDALRLGVSASRVHVFDARTGAAVERAG